MSGPCRPRLSQRVSRLTAAQRGGHRRQFRPDLVGFPWLRPDPTIASQLAVSGKVVNLRGPHDFAPGIKEIRDQFAAIAQTVGMKPADSEPTEYRTGLKRPRTESLSAKHGYGGLLTRPPKLRRRREMGCLKPREITHAIAVLAPSPAPGFGLPKFASKSHAHLHAKSAFAE